MTDAVARLRRWARERPDSVLLLTRGHEYTYADVYARATSVAAALGAAGAGRGRRVALLLEEYDEFFVAMLGVWLAGSVVVPLNVSLPAADIDWLMEKSRPDVLVLGADAAREAAPPVPPSRQRRRPSRACPCAAARTAASRGCGRPATRRRRTRPAIPADIRCYFRKRVRISGIFTDSENQGLWFY